MSDIRTEIAVYMAEQAIRSLSDVSVNDLSDHIDELEDAAEMLYTLIEEIKLNETDIWCGDQPDPS